MSRDTNRPELASALNGAPETWALRPVGRAYSSTTMNTSVHSPIVSKRPGQAGSKASRRAPESPSTWREVRYVCVSGSAELSACLRQAARRTLRPSAFPAAREGGREEVSSSSSGERTQERKRTQGLDGGHEDRSARGLGRRGEGVGHSAKVAVGVRARCLRRGSSIPSPQSPRSGGLLPDSFSFDLRSIPRSHLIENHSVPFRRCLTM